MMKKRVLPLLLSLLIVMTACAGTTSEETESSPGQPIAENITDESEESEEPGASALIRERYADTDLGGHEYKVLAVPTDGHFYTQVSSGINEVWADEMNGEVINDAIYSRNLSSEDLLNIRISPIWATGDTGGIRSQLHNEVLAGSAEYEAVLNRMDYMGTNMQNGDLLNIRNIREIDTNDFWWDANIVEAFTLFGNKLYWISGDLNIFDDFAAEVVFFNKEICTDSGMDFPYSLVEEGKWTIDSFYTMAHTAERDLDGNGTLDPKKDIVGHCEGNDHVKHWIYAMGEKSLDIGEDGSLTVRLTEERQIRAVDTLYQYMVERSMTYTGATPEFKGGHTLFLGIMVGWIGSLRDMETEFGVLPMPKLDEEQERYGEYISNGWCTAYGIPMTNPDPATTGIILDAICAFSNETLHDALYNTLFGAKFVRDPESVEMLDIIFTSKMYDWAVDFTWGGSFQTCYNGIYENKQNNFVSQTQKSLKLISKGIEKLVDAIRELDY